MSDSINPDHYRNGPFECIELTRLLSFEWGNVVKYCFRWKRQERRRRPGQGRMVRQGRHHARRPAHRRRPQG